MFHGWPCCVSLIPVQVFFSTCSVNVCVCKLFFFHCLFVSLFVKKKCILKATLTYFILVIFIFRHSNDFIIFSIRQLIVYEMVNNAYYNFPGAKVT